MSQNPTGQRRARVQLSCAPCRQSKLKCNREQPTCDQCLKRSRSTHCIYATLNLTRRPRPHVRGRIQHLERLVVELMSAKDHDKASPNGQDSQSSRDGPGLPSSSSSSWGIDGSRNADLETSPNHSLDTSDTSLSGQLRVSQTETSYVGGSHWAAILNDV